MALIQCPECGEMISDFASTCMHCGFPLKHIKKHGENVCVIDGKPLDLREFKEFINNVLDSDGGLSEEEIESLVDSLYSDCEHSSKDSIRCLIHIMINSREIPSEHNSMIYKMRLKNEEDARQRYAENKRKEREIRDEIHCPKCNSTAVTAGQRGYSVVWGFVGSNKTMNRCAKCGHKWAPRR